MLTPSMEATTRVARTSVARPGLSPAGWTVHRSVEAAGPVETLAKVVQRDPATLPAVLDVR